MMCSRHLQQLQEDKSILDAAHIQVVAISVEKASASREFRRQNHPSYPILTDSAAASGVGSAYRVFSPEDQFNVPAFFLVASSGKILISEVGPPHAPFPYHITDKALERLGHKRVSSPSKARQQQPEASPLSRQ